MRLNDSALFMTNSIYTFTRTNWFVWRLNFKFVQKHQQVLQQLKLIGLVYFCILDFFNGFGCCTLFSLIQTKKKFLFKASKIVPFNKKYFTKFVFFIFSGIKKNIFIASLFFWIANYSQHYWLILSECSLKLHQTRFTG